MLLIAHFSARGKVKHLARGFDIVNLDEFEDGALR